MNSKLKDENVDLKMKIMKRERRNKLTDMLLKEHRYEDLQKANDDVDYQEELFKHYGL